jgi:hypothetical protein
MWPIHVWRSQTPDGFRCAHFPSVITTIMYQKVQLPRVDRLHTPLFPSYCTQYKRRSLIKCCERPQAERVISCAGRRGVGNFSSYFGRSIANWVALNVFLSLYDLLTHSTIGPGNLNWVPSTYTTPLNTPAPRFFFKTQLCIGPPFQNLT